MNLTLRVRDAMRAAGVPPGPLVVALSGGPDSLCLLHLLADLADAEGWRLTAAHLDHALRPESADEAAMVVRLAASRGVACRTQRQPVVRDGTGLEAAARRARYAFLATVAGELGGAPVALGHNANDQAETLLLRLARGAGTTGLAAMRRDTSLPGSAWNEPTALPLRLLRPLLGVERREIEAELAHRGLQPLRDPTNRGLAFARNRIRHLLLARWQRLEPTIVARLARAADLLAEDDAALEALVAARWPLVALHTTDGPALSRGALLAEPVALQRRLLRHAARLATGHTPGQKAVDAALALLRAGHAGDLDLRPGLHLTVVADEARLATTPRQPSGAWMAVGAAVPLPVPGTRVLPGDAWRLVCVRQAPADCSATLGPRHAHFSTALAAGDPNVRTVRPGDRLRLLAGGSAKVSDIFINRKVPRAWRSAVPLLCAGGEVAWVVGHAVAKGYAASGDESEIICCRAERVAGG